MGLNEVYLSMSLLGYGMGIMLPTSICMFLSREFFNILVSYATPRGLCVLGV